jgi:hypothetical protein
VKGAAPAGRPLFRFPYGACSLSPRLISPPATDLGIDAHIDVAESALEGSDDVEVTLRRYGIDLGCRTSGNRRDHPQPCRSEGDLGADPAVLAPGRRACEIDIRAKPQRVDRHPHRRLQCRDARSVDQRDVFVGRRIRLAPRISKGVPRRLDDAQRPVHVAEEIREELRHLPASFRLGNRRA